MIAAVFSFFHGDAEDSRYQFDECEDEQDARLILRLFSQARDLNAQGVRMRIFITSRPETPIRLGFRNDILASDHQDFILHHISQPTIEHGITVFLHHELEKIWRDREGSSCTSQGGPGATKIELLCKKACGLFMLRQHAVSLGIGPGIQRKFFHCSPG